MAFLWGKSKRLKARRENMKKRSRILAWLLVGAMTVSNSSFIQAASLSNELVEEDTEVLLEEGEEDQPSADLEEPESGGEMTEPEEEETSIEPLQVNDSGEILHYDMNAADGQLVDASGQGRNAALVDLDESDVNTYDGVSVLDMDGSGYVELPEGIVDDETLTVNITAATTQANNQWLYTMGEDNWSYTFVTPSNSSKDTKFAISRQDPYNGTGAWANEKSIYTDAAALDGSYQTYTVVYNEGTTSLYVDGVKIGDGENPYGLMNVVPADGGHAYIGKSLYNEDPLFRGKVADLSIYSEALDEEQVAEIAGNVDNSQYVKADVYAAMLGNNVSADQITEDLSFPSSVDGSSVSWQVTKGEDMIGENGKLTKPAADTEAEVTASFEVDGQQITEAFQLTVKGASQEELEALAKDLTLPYSTEAGKEVYGNITLPETVNGRGIVTWETDHPEIVDVNEQENDGAYAEDPTPAGVVTRPDKDTDVTMTAVITLGDYSTEKEFTFTVKAAPEEVTDEDLTDYFFAYFTGEGYSDGEQIYFSASHDGLNWKELNDNKPALTSTLGEKGVRDPFILRSAEGDKFYLIATDLKINGGSGWGAAQTAGSQSLMVWESTDLVNWSDQRMVEVSAEIDAGCTWAPEATYDEVTGEYVVYWASRIAGDNYAKQVVYYAKTRDFYSFTEPQVFIEKDADTIDTTILYENGKYYRYSKNETNKNIIAEVTDTLLHSEPTMLDTPVLGSQGGVEGPSIYKFNQDDVEKNGWQYCLLVDNYGGIGYYPMVPKDLNGDFERLTSGFQLPGGSRSPRHGTPMRITAEEYAKVAEAYNASPEELIQVTFDGEEYASFVPSMKEYEIVLKEGEDYPELAAEAETGYEIQIQQPNEEDPTAVITLKNPEGGVESTYTFTFVKEETLAQDPVLEYNFDSDAAGSKTASDTGAGDDTADNGTLYGNAAIAQDAERGSQVLNLNGSSNTYLEFPKGFFDNRNTMTITMDVKSNMSSGNFFTFTYGKDSNVYDFLRIRGTSVRNAITTSSWGAEKEVAGTGAATGTWQHIALVYENTSMKLYIDGELVSTNANTGITTSMMGSDLLAYLGKSMYSADAYFNGSFDNVKVFERPLDLYEVREEAGVAGRAFYGVDAEGYTFINSDIDNDEKVITLNISRNNSEAKDLKAVPLTFDLGENVILDEENGAARDLSEPVEMKVDNNGEEEIWTIDATLCYNPVLGGQFADPDVDVFDGKFYIYPTTDGVEGWGGTQFHVFSSDDMIDWVDEGVIVDVADDNAGLNENGVQIGTVPWSKGNAWAPTIEEKNGKYYYYFCAREKDTDKQAMGVAVSDSPTGPFVVKDEPIVNMADCAAEGISMGQTIDPSIFTDPDTGKSYMLFGNGNGAIVELTEDMMDFVPGTMKNISGLRDFREAVTITKRDGVYHFTWSCDDTGSENYHVNYGTSDSPYGPVNYQYTILQKDPENDILGTGHHSILYMPETDEAYIVYAKFMTPLGQVTGGFGYHREVCIDKLTFDEETGLMNPVTPTLTGITEPVKAPASEEEQMAAFQEVMPEVTAKADGSSVVVEWKSIENAGSYRIYRKEAGGSFKGLATVSADETSYVDETTQTGVTYYYTVKGFWEEDASGVATQYPTDVQVYVPIAEADFAKVVPQVSAKVNADKSVTISWKEIKEARSYRIYRKEAGGSFKGLTNAAAGTTSMTDTTAKPGVTYYYTVKGFWEEDAQGTCTQYPTDVTAKIPADALATPAVKTRSVNYCTVEVSWNEVTGADKYVIYRKEAKAGTSFKSIGTVSAGTLKYRDGSAKMGVNYYYTVKAYAGSIYSDYQKTVTGMAVPSSPTLKAASSSKGVTITWTGSRAGANEFADGYRIFRKTAGGSWKTVGTVGANTRSFTDTTGAKGTTYYYTVRAYVRQSDGTNLWGTYNTSGVTGAKK